MTQGFVEFEFDLPTALLTSLVHEFERMNGAALLTANVQQIPEAQGVYQLLLRDEVVYIGKTDAEAGLRKRLERHARTIQHRQNLSSSDITFKAVRVFVFTAMDLETQLIRYYKNTAWNNSGFGSNDPGRERDTTNIKPQGFDALFPIDIDQSLVFELPSHAPADKIIAELKTALPYTFRVQTAEKKARKAHQEIEEAMVTIPEPPYTVRSLVSAILAALPPGWQATVLAGRIIMYKESREYSYGSIIGRS